MFNSFWTRPHPTYGWPSTGTNIKVGMLRTLKAFTNSFSISLSTLKYQLPRAAAFFDRGVSVRNTNSCRNLSTGTLPQIYTPSHFLMVKHLPLKTILCQMLDHSIIFGTSKLIVHDHTFDNFQQDSFLVYKLHSLSYLWKNHCKTR